VAKRLETRIRRRFVRWLKALALGFVVLLASLLAVLVVGLLWPTTAAPVQRTTTAIAITGAHVVDVASGSTKNGLTVVVEGSRVIAVGAAAEFVPPPGSKVVDGSGRYLIPGFWDMHVHIPIKLSPQFHLPLFIAYGASSMRATSSRSVIPAPKRSGTAHEPLPRGARPAT